MASHRLFYKDLNSGNYFDYFLITSVTTVLLIRTFLRLTNYIQLGSGELHIAHVLYGGFFMLIAIIIFLSFLNESIKEVSAVIGGFGFGFFIDELGKFITQDNNYFYRPTIALVYLTFIALYLVTKVLENRSSMMPEEYFANAMEKLKQLGTGSLSYRSKQQIIKYLKYSDQANPIAPHLIKLVQSIPASPLPELSRFSALKKWISSVYHRFIYTRRFSQSMVALFTIQSIFNLLQTVALLNNNQFSPSTIIALGLSELLIIAFALTLITHRYPRTFFLRLLIGFLLMFFAYLLFRIILVPPLPTLSLSRWVDLSSSSLATLIAIFGLINLRRSPHLSLRLLRYSLLINIYITQFFAFYEDQLSALLGLSFNILTLIALQFFISENRVRSRPTLSRLRHSP